MCPPILSQFGATSESPVDGHVRLPNEQQQRAARPADHVHYEMAASDRA
jgi:hypothetical protein